MRTLRLLALALLAVPAAAQNFQGVWSGTTSQGKTISITVDSGNGIPNLSFGGTVTGSGCSASFDSSFGGGVGQVSSSGAFTASFTASIPGALMFNMSGTLSASGNGSGSVTFNSVPAPGICGGSGSATFTVSKQGTTTPGNTVAILAVVGSVQGAALFRTEVQIYNPRTTAISGRFVFHAQGTSGSATDPSMSYTLQGGQTIDYPDLLPAMGLSGLGSLDIQTNGDPAPIMVARVFSDAGDAGTAGFTIDAVAPSAALQAGDSAAIIVPPDLTRARLNIGFRSLDTGASIFMSLRSKSGTQKGTGSRTLAANFFEQLSVGTLFPGLPIDGSDTITFTLNSGKAIIYGATTENKTQDPSLQYAKKTF